MVPRPDTGPGTWQTLRCVERRTRLQKVRSCPLPDSPPLPSRQLHAPAHTGWAAPGAPWSFVLLDLCTCSCLTCSPRPLPIPHNPGTSSPPPPMGPEPLTWAGLWGAAHLQGLQYNSWFCACLSTWTLYLSKAGCLLLHALSLVCRGRCELSPSAGRAKQAPSQHPCLWMC